MGIAHHTLEIVGAGPAGLSAAIAGRRAGSEVVVYEKRLDVGGRFHGDLQGIENWTSDQDVLEEVADYGIEPTFEYTPAREVTCFDPNGRAYELRAGRPIFYLVRRGSAPGTLDAALKQQARQTGVELRLNSRRLNLERGGIVAEGPHQANVIAAGLTFATEMADIFMAAISGSLAFGGYAYLLVACGRGTVATCLFGDFHREREYLERTIEFFRKNASLRWTSSQSFGGSGNFACPTTARRGQLLYAGESAGFQDALLGFGIRYAIRSGHLAARAYLRDPGEYDSLWRQSFGAQLRAAAANRRLLNLLGDRGCNLLLRLIVAGRDPGSTLRRIYADRWWKHVLLPRPPPMAFGRRAIVRPGCDCTWCRCHAETVH